MRTPAFWVVANPLMICSVNTSPGATTATPGGYGAIKSAAKVVVGGPAESIFHIDVSPCSITTVSIWPSDGLRALRSLNEQAHLQ